jgi:hypothetical protein
MHMEMDEKTVFSASGPCNSEVLFFSILVVQNYLTEISDLPWLGILYKVLGGCADHRPPNRKDQLLPKANPRDLTYSTVNNGPQKENQLGATCVPQKYKEMRTKSNVIMQYVVVC